MHCATLTYHYHLPHSMEAFCWRHGTVFVLRGRVMSLANADLIPQMVKNSHAVVQEQGTLLQRRPSAMVLRSERGRRRDGRSGAHAGSTGMYIAGPSSMLGVV